MSVLSGVADPVIRHAVKMISLAMMGSVVVSASLVAQKTEQVGRLELSNGYVSVEARADGLMTLAVLGALHFDVGSGVFSPRTTTAWLARVTTIVDSLRNRTRSAIGESPDLLAATGETRFRFTFELGAVPSLSSVHFLRADGVNIGLSGSAGDTTFSALLSLLRSGAERTMALTLASPDSARAYLSDMELTDRVPKAEIVVRIGRTPWKAADRIFVTFASSALTGLAVSYANHAANDCVSVGYCRWKMDNPGFAVGSVAGSSAAGLALSPAGKCSRGQRLATIVAVSAAGAVPGALLAEQGRQLSLAVTPGLQTILIEALMKRCRA